MLRLTLPIFGLLVFLKPAFTQERSFNILLGILPYTTEFGSTSSVQWKPRLGFVLGLDYWAKNKKGEVWSAGISYQTFKRRGDVTSNGQTFPQEETFEYLNLHGAPLIWQFGKKEQFFAEVGGFFNFLLHQEAESRGNVVDNTPLFQKIYLGPSAGIGARLGDPGGSKLIIGLRNELGLASFGSGSVSAKFNTFSLYVGLGI
ncbi:MAG: hypothetical protein OHK0019_19050 [Saprospiraceae bacterium]